MSVLMGVEVLEALRVCVRRARSTESLFESLFCMAIFMSFLFEGEDEWEFGGEGMGACLILRSMGGVVVVLVA
jgi:hypothetical protein